MNLHYLDNLVVAEIVALDVIEPRRTDWKFPQFAGRRDAG